MHIAYVTETYPPEVNGVALTAERTVNELRRRGHTVRVIRPRQAGEAACDDAREWRTTGLPVPLYRDLRFGITRVSTLVSSLAGAPPDIVHVATPGPLGWAAVSAARRLRLAVTTDFRTNFDQYSRYYRLGWAEPLIRTYLRHLHNRSLCTFVPTRQMRDRLSGQGFRNLRIVGRGVDAIRFAPFKRSAALRQRWGAGDAPVLLYAGRLAGEKNVELALRAYETARTGDAGVRMVLVGDGPERARLQSAYPTAIFAGMQHGEELARHYASADAFLFPSLSDTFGNVVLEALASGLPVLAFDVAAAAEHVGDAVSGRLIAPGDDAAFIAACVALAHAPAPAMRQAARAAALAADWDRVVARFEDDLARTAEAHRAGALQPAYAR